MICILDFLDLVIRFILIIKGFRTFIAQRIEILESVIAFLLHVIQLLLNLIVAVIQCLGLGIIASLFKISNLSLKIINCLLLLSKSSKAFLCSVKSANIRKSFLFIHEFHSASVHLLLKTINLALNILLRFVWHTTSSILLLVEEGLQLFLELFDLLQVLATNIFVSLMFLAD